MSAQLSDFEALMRRVAGGSEAAVWELLDRYSKNILRTVRRHLPTEIRSKVDSVDIVQSVWKSLLKKGPRLDELATADQLFAYVASMARLKVYETHRHFTKQAKADVRREVRQTGAIHAEGPRPGETREPVDRRANTPSAIIQAQENWECAAKRLGTRVEQVVELRLQGATLDEIAEQMTLSKSTVRRLLTSMLNSLDV
jgi:RNA polymerase sigma factor (sigma-70 family)